MAEFLEDNADKNDIADWMAQRWKQVAGADDAEMAGRDAWAMGTRSGLNPPATTYADLLKLGAAAQGEGSEPYARALKPGPARQPTDVPRLRDRALVGGPNSQSAPPPPGGSGGRPVATFGALRVDPLSDVERNKLLSDQAQFGRIRRHLDIKNSYLAIPALAPAVVAMGLEGAAALTTRLAGPVEVLPPFRFPGPPKAGPGGGDSFQAYLGRQADRVLRDLVEAKPGWESQPSVTRNGQRYRPDAATPPRNPTEPDQRSYLEQKPNTPSGRRAAARDVKYYEGALERKVRAIFYNPADFL